jgi:hypothetical protein
MPSKNCIINVCKEVQSGLVNPNFEFVNPKPALDRI